MNSFQSMKGSGKPYKTRFGWDRLSKKERLEKLLKRNQHGGKKKKHETPRQLLNVARNEVRAMRKVEVCKDQEIRQAWVVYKKNALGERVAYAEYFIPGIKEPVRTVLALFKLLYKDKYLL